MWKQLLFSFILVNRIARGSNTVRSLTAPIRWIFSRSFTPESSVVLTTQVLRMESGMHAEPASETTVPRLGVPGYE